ncbi:MAG: cyclopropane-fatty-acyl-phospholipid synthase family protein [Gemmatimonadota bacterium]
MLRRMLRRMLAVGRLEVAYADGKVEHYGDGSGPPVRVRLNRRGEWRIGTHPELGLGESYMDGDLVVEQGDIWSVLEIMGRNMQHWPWVRRGLLARLVHAAQRRLQQWNDRESARRNVAHHYDLSDALYRRFLDADMQYSCAYFERPDMTLEEAQAAKKAHIAAKLRLEPGMRVLDIGCGWGGMGLELAGRHGAQVAGVTLSKEQLAVAQQRAREAGLEERAQFSLTDYRDVAGPFERIVSVGMFEHVGAPNYRAFFRQIRRLLTDDGAAVIHSIGRMDGPGITNPFIAKYIFPGGYVPALSEVTAAVEDEGLWITDIEVLRIHYAETVLHWRERFMADREAISALYDERFCRMWEFYLAVSELSFRYVGHMVFQLQLAKRVDALPITRTYMVDDERAGPRLARPSRRRSAA